MRRSPGFSCAFAMLMASASAGSQAAAPVTPLDEALAMIKERALNASSVDWVVVEDEVRGIAQATPGEKGTTAAIRRLIVALNDGHSFYLPPRRMPSNITGVERRRPSGEHSQFNERPPIAVSDSSGLFGRIRINAWTGEPNAIIDASNVVRAELNKALATSHCGVIVDLTSNKGGNMWPMMAGIAPLYSEGPVLSFVDRSDKRKNVSVKEGAILLDGEPNPSATEILPLATPAPRYIAVILGKRTSSSGEITALGFRGQANARSFGEPTAGQTTSNSSKRLSNGGMLAIATSRVADRNGVVANGPIVPDVATADPEADANAWLQQSCQASN